MVSSSSIVLAAALLVAATGYASSDPADNAGQNPTLSTLDQQVDTNTARAAPIEGAQSPDRKCPADNDKSHQDKAGGQSNEPSKDDSESTQEPHR